jgi:arginyl-tRNA synthetase
LHEALGYDVIRINHVGDWYCCYISLILHGYYFIMIELGLYRRGTQFGMLILHLKRNRPDLFDEIVRGPHPHAADSLQRLDLVEFYKAARKNFDEDQSNFKELSRLEVVALQNGNADSIAVWKFLCSWSRREFQKVYDVLKVRIEERGESFYHPYIAGLLEDLHRAGLVTRSEGALVFKPPGAPAEELSAKEPSLGAESADGEHRADPALMLQKSDGGFLYATTDLAAIRYRFAPWGDAADRVLYVTDFGQALHFRKSVSPYFYVCNVTIFTFFFS